MEYKNLLDAMQSKGLSDHAIAAAVGMSETAFRMKASGQTKNGFTILEAMSIRNSFFPDAEIAYLFDRSKV